MKPEAGPREHEWFGWGGWFANYDGEYDGATVRRILDAGFAMRDELRGALVAEREACARAIDAILDRDRAAYRGGKLSVAAMQRVEATLKEAVAAIRARGTA